MALLEWSDTVYDLITVSIHTYERAPQVVRTLSFVWFTLIDNLGDLQMSMDSSLFHANLRVDPQSRCAALSLPKDAIAILPFYQSQADADVMEHDQGQNR